MNLLINDPEIADRLRAEREATDGAKHDEVWDGVYVMSPLPNNQHQLLVNRLERILVTVVDESKGDMVFPGVNVSDREEDWQSNYREPDVAVILHENPGKDCETHWRGGPDFVVEILSPDDHAREKRGFYSSVGVRELLIVDRKPWALELYRLNNGSLDLVGRSTGAEPEPVLSDVLPLAFRIVPGKTRPAIEITDTRHNRSWII